MGIGIGIHGHAFALAACHWANGVLTEPAQ